MQSLFEKKMQSKSSEELKRIIESGSKYVEEARTAALNELNKRVQDGTFELEEQERKERLIPKGEDKYDAFLSTVKTEGKVSFKAPKYSKTFTSRVKSELIYVVTLEVFDRLEWEVVYQNQEERTVEAKRHRDSRKGEKIIVQFDLKGNITVCSTSLGGELWDMGRNSERVLLYEHVFEEVTTEMSEEKLLNMKTEIDKEENWDNYVIPESLPAPKSLTEPNIWIPIIAGVFGVTVLGGLFAVVSQVIYILILFEVGIGIGLGYTLGIGLKKGNYTNYSSFFRIILVSVIGIVVMNQVFQYLIIINQHGFVGQVSFYQFLEARFQAGFVIKDFNTGWIGWIAVWCFQLIVIGWVCWLRLFSTMIQYRVDRVPMEVIDFAFYHLIKGKSEVGIRNELARMGWIESREQDNVFEALASIQESMYMNRD